MTSDPMEPPPDKQVPNQGRRDWQKKYAKRGLRLSRRTLMVTIGVGVITAVGVAAGVLALVNNGKSGGGDTVSSNRVSQVSGGCGQVGVTNNCEVLVEQLDEFSARARNEAEFRREVAKASTGPPQGSGPWTYVVVGTGDLGLKVRSNGEQDGVHVGGVTNQSILWVDCVATTSFEPDPVINAGAKWLRVRWPNQRPSKEWFSSAPGDKYRGYAYVGYTIPYGHNGNIPACG
jgi:hypothetical protein